MTKLGRNDACPCGSGQKYKLCHDGIAEDMVKLGTRLGVFGKNKSPWDPEKQQRFSAYFEPSNSLFYQPPSTPFDISVVEMKADFPSIELECLLDCVRWEVPPPFYT